VTRTWRGTRLADLAAERGLDEAYRHEIRVVASVLPFKVDRYVVDELIDWSAVPDDPIFRLTFPARGMLPDDVYEPVSKLIRDGAGEREVRAAVTDLRVRLNPHPSGQAGNVPLLDGEPVGGLQHKYRHTVLVFPSPGQTCHSYCGYCFRWAQFVGEPGLRFASSRPDDMVTYVRRHPEVTDVLLTGGDPLVMSTPVLRRWIDPLLDIGHVSTIRIGTKALAYAPRRVTDDPTLLHLVERCVNAGRQVAVMMHVSHARELATDSARQAVSLLRGAGATLRAQAPIIRRVNDDPAAWADMWQAMVSLGIAPYYSFVERDTGAMAWFEVPLARALAVHTGAQRRVGGLARTARGPVMSATPGKIVIDGEATVGGERVFVLRMLQARDPALTGRVFFAHHSADATWIDGLRPAFAPHWPWETDGGSE
jgi:KamA family protein